MGFRIFMKSGTIAVRARTRFIVFTLIYTVLVFWLAYMVQAIFDGSNDYVPFIVAIIASVVLSVLYAWILINYRKKEIATLKCIGWTNGDIRTLIVGEILWVTIISVAIVAEILIHFAAITSYAGDPIVLLGISSVAATVGLFIVSQIVGILIVYRRILKLRPIVALRVLK